MDTGERRLSQETLAKLTGYTDRSSITKIEKGLVDLQQSKIELFAKALGTTSRELVGWDDEPVQKKKGVVINVLGRVAAGIPIEAVEEVRKWHGQEPSSGSRSMETA